MLLPTHHIRRIAITVGTVITIIAILWWGIWSIAASQYRSVLNGWISSGRAAGYEITYDDQKLFGFPRHMVLRFTNVHWKNNDNISFHADDIDIAATPWEWQSFEAKFKNHVEIDAPINDSGLALILGGEDGRAHVELDREGFWKLSRISLLHAQVGQTPNYVVLAEKLEASAERPTLLPKDHTEAGLTLTGSAENITLPSAMPSPFGLKMAKLNVAMRVMGDVPDFRKRESVDVWNKISGVVEFDKLNMNWGPLNLKSKGTMGFDDDLQPEGAFSSEIDGHEAVLKALMEHDFIARSQAGMLNSALSLFAKPVVLGHNSESNAVELPIAVQLGGLFLGPVRIFTFPEIDWPPVTSIDGIPSDKPATEVPSPAP